MPRFLQGYRAQSFPSPAIRSEVFHWLCLNSCYSKRFWLDLKILLQVLMNEKNIDDLVLFLLSTFPSTRMRACVKVAMPSRQGVIDSSNVCFPLSPPTRLAVFRGKSGMEGFQTHFAIKLKTTAIFSRRLTAQQQQTR